MCKRDRAGTTCTFGTLAGSFQRSIAKAPSNWENAGRAWIFEPMEAMPPFVAPISMVLIAGYAILSWKTLHCFPRICASFLDCLSLRRQEQQRSYQLNPIGKSKLIAHPFLHRHSFHEHCASFKKRVGAAMIRVSG